MENEDEKNIRHPRNLQGLLRFAMEATKAEDAPSNDENKFERMDDERRKFLENALRALTINIIEELQKAVSTIGSDSKSEQEKIEAIDCILQHVDDIDTSIDFFKIGGICILEPCLTSPYSEIRKKAAVLVAELVQNNTYCQKAVLEANLFPHLINLLSDDETAIYGMRAVSCLVRGYEPAFKAFIEMGGYECLLGCIQQTKDKKLIMRAAFLLNSLCSEYPTVTEELTKLGAVKIILPLILAGSDSYCACLETLLSTLCLLIQCDLAKVHLRQEHDAIAKLKHIVKVSKDKPECQEIVEYSVTLLKNIKESSSEFMEN